MMHKLVIPQAQYDDYIRQHGLEWTQRNFDVVPIVPVNTAPAWPRHNAEVQLNRKVRRKMKAINKKGKK